MIFVAETYFCSNTFFCRVLISFKDIDKELNFLGFLYAEMFGINSCQVVV